MFIFDNKELTISEKDLSFSEKKSFESLVRLGDSKELALWTIEHQERKIKNNREDYARAYYG